eukprot:s279_g30.t1
MEREQRPLALRTTAGPVDLRPPRQERRITTNEGASARTIKKGWLKDTQGDASYQKAVKQAMMIAAEELRLMDAKEASASSAYSKPEIEEIQERIQRLQLGNARFPLTGTKKKKLQNVTQHRGDRKSLQRNDSLAFRIFQSDVGFSVIDFLGEISAFKIAVNVVCVSSCWCIGGALGPSTGGAVKSQIDWSKLVTHPPVFDYLNQFSMKTVILFAKRSIATLSAVK